jgi:hypothetical protein
MGNASWIDAGNLLINLDNVEAINISTDNRYVTFFFCNKDDKSDGSRTTIDLNDLDDDIITKLRSICIK